MNVAVAILRVPEGLDFTGIIADFDLSDLNSAKSKKKGIDNPQFSSCLEVTTKQDNDDMSELSLCSTEVTEISQSEATSTLNDSNHINSTQQKQKTKSGRVLYKQGKYSCNARNQLLLKGCIFLCRRDPKGNPLPNDVYDTICRFRIKQKRGTIDVWWLYDDGGLSMLLPHILTTRSNWATSKLRVFCLADINEGHEKKQERCV